MATVHTVRPRPVRAQRFLAAVLRPATARFASTTGTTPSKAASRPTTAATRRSKTTSTPGFFMQGLEIASPDPVSHIRLVRYVSPQAHAVASSPTSASPLAPSAPTAAEFSPAERSFHALFMASQERHHAFWRAEQHALNAAMMAFADARMSASVAAEAEAEAEPCTASGAESASATPLTPFVTADTAAADTALCTFFRAHQAARAPAFRAYNTDLYRDRFALLAPGFRADAARIKRWASSALRSSSSTLSRPLSPAAASAPTSPAAAWAATTWLIREFGGFIGLSLAPRGRAQGISVR